MTQMLMTVSQLILACALSIAGVVEIKPGAILYVNTSVPVAFCSGPFIVLSDAAGDSVQHELIHIKQYSQLGLAFYPVIAVPSVATNIWHIYLYFVQGADAKFLHRIYYAQAWERPL